MAAQIIDGKKIGQALKIDVRADIARLGFPPGLAVILVGDNPASLIYIANKHKACADVGIKSYTHKLPATAQQSEVLEVIEALNYDPAVNGILLQLPLPHHLNARALIMAIDPEKDVDGLHPVNLGRLVLGESGFVPCTPLGCMHLIRSCVPDLTGKKVVVIGRSILVGKPLALLLSAADATVTLAHSKTLNLPKVCQQADILVVAIGQPKLITEQYVKPGALVIDVGINHVETNGQFKIQGDVDFDTVSQIAGFLTPVPGGVGPMTIACLLANTYQAAVRYGERVG